jgi:hypothetical protein
MPALRVLTGVEALSWQLNHRQLIISVHQQFHEGARYVKMTTK